MRFDGKALGFGVLMAVPWVAVSASVGLTLVVCGTAFVSGVVIAHGVQAERPWDAKSIGWAVLMALPFMLMGSADSLYWTLVLGPMGFALGLYVAAGEKKMRRWHESNGTWPRSR